jgi:hypothetical protein
MNPFGLLGRRRLKPHYKLEARDTDYGAGRLLGLLGLLGYWVTWVIELIEHKKRK